MHNRPLVSVVIPTYNSERTLEKSLRSVRAQTHERVEIIVVDNYSTDRTQEIAKKYNARALLAMSERSRAKNLGTKAALGKYVLFIDSDMVIEPSVIEECVRIIESDKRFGAVIIPERSVGSNFWVSVRDFERHLYKETEIESARFFKKDIIMKAGGFDEDIIFFEESSLPHRIDALGYNTKARVDSMILHLEDNFSLNKWLMKKHYYGKSASIYQKKYKNYAKNQMSFFSRLALFLFTKAFYRKPHLAFGLLILKSIEFFSFKINCFSMRNARHSNKTSRYLQENIKTMKCLEKAVPFFVSLFWIFLLLFHTHGGLLVGGDWAGYYDPTRMFTSLISPQEIIYDLALIFAGGNIYAGFYLGLFTSAFLTCLSIFYLAKSLFKDYLNEKSLMVVASLSTVLYLFSLVSVLDTFKSLVNTVSVVNAGFFLFLAELSNLVKSEKFHKKFGKRNMVLMGIGIGVSSALPPNTFRMLTIEIVLITLAILIVTVPRKFIHVKQIIGKIMPSVLISIIVMLYWIIPFVSNLEPNIQTLTSAYTARSYGQPSTITPNYATLLQVIRLTGAWYFQTEYMPYHNLYFNNLPIVATSFLLPIFALGMPLLFCRKRERPFILFLVAGMLSIIFWEKGGNYPLGEIYAALISFVPQIQGILPTHFLQLRILSTLYPIMTAFSISRLHDVTRTRIRLSNPIWDKISSFFVPAFLLFLLLIPAYPLWSGIAVGQYFDSDIKGIRIPDEYSSISNILANTMKWNETILIYPGISTYIQTSWGYQGTNSFYNNYFSPLMMITPDYFGVYSEYNTKLSRDYTSIISPHLSPYEKKEQTIFDFEKMKVYHAASEIGGELNTLNIYNFTTDTDPWIDLVLPFEYEICLDNFTLAIIELPFLNNDAFAATIENGGLHIGIMSRQNVGWYVVGSSLNSYYAIDSSGNIENVLLLGSSDELWETATYDLDNVDGIIIRLIKADITGTSLEFRLPRLYVSAEVLLSEDYMSLILQNNVKYVLCDKSLQTVRQENYETYNLIVEALVKAGFLATIYQGRYISLYQFSR